MLCFEESAQSSKLQEGTGNMRPQSSLFASVPLSTTVSTVTNYRCSGRSSCFESTVIHIHVQMYIGSILHIMSMMPMHAKGREQNIIPYYITYRYRYITPLESTVPVHHASVVPTAVTNLRTQSRMVLQTAPIFKQKAPPPDCLLPPRHNGICFILSLAAPLFLIVDR